MTVRKRRALSRIPNASKNAIVSLILRYDLLNRRELRVSFLSTLLATKKKQPATKLVQGFWDVVLSLSKAYLTDTPTVVTDICLMSVSSESTVKRQLRKLVLLGVVDKFPDENDRRRQFVILKKPYLEVLDSFVKECDVEFRELIEHNDRRQREKVLKALEESERRFRDYAEMSADWFWEMDEELRFSNISDGLSRALGIDKNYFIGKTRRELVADKDMGSPHIKSHLEDLDAHREFEDFIYCYKTPVGSERFVRTSGRPLFNDQKKFIGYRGTASDITERKRVEIALLESEVHYRELFDRAPLPYQSLDAEAKIITVNKAWLDAFGYSSEEVIGTFIGDYITPESIETLHENFPRFAKTGSIHGPHFDFLCKDGDVRTISVEGRIAFDEDGSFRQTHCILTDITERKKMEDILRNIAEGVSGAVGKTFFDRLVGFLAKALEVDYAFIGRLAQGGESVWTVSLYIKGEIADNIEYRLKGTPCENVTGKDLAIYEEGVADYFPEDRGLRDKNIESYAGAPLFDSSDRPLGILVVMSEAPLKLPAMVRSLMRIFAVRVATELEREMALEKLELSREEAETANNAKSEFLAHMSHDLRTPLNAIMGFSQMMTQHIFGPLGDPHYEEYAKDINDSGNLLLSLIDDILDISKIEAGKYELTKQKLNVSSCVKVSVRMLRPQAEAKKIRLAYIAEQDLQWLRGDKTAIIQILNNLLSNAIKFTPDEGEVTVNARMFKGSRLNIQVTDTGIGMSREDITKALNPFEQIDSRHSRKHEGTGLGLHLCCRLVDLHDGEMTFESEIGKGTTVTVSFPPERVVRNA